MVSKICGAVGENMNSPRCRALKKHLEECTNCREYLRSIRKTILLYQGYPTPELTKKSRRDLLRKLF
jgi:predicted anti-sigma-YlaC factor YlaD